MADQGETFIPDRPTHGPHAIWAAALAAMGAVFAVAGVLALFAWLFTLPAFILGIVAAVKPGRKKSLAIAAIVVSTLAWLTACVVAFFWIDANWFGGGTAWGPDGGNSGLGTAIEATVSPSPTRP